MATKKTASITLHFEAERVTKNTVRFVETDAGDGVTYVGYLYVQKHALRDLGNPEELKVTIERAATD